jgi:ribosomal protein S18 acetylase RimI-like enzyme
MPKIDHIGLNVHESNATAIDLYSRLGFKIIGSYHEYMATAGGGRADAAVPMKEG